MTIGNNNTIRFHNHIILCFKFCFSYHANYALSPQSRAICLVAAHVVVYPVNVTRNWCKCCVVFAICHHETGDAILLPWSIALSANVRTTTVTSTSISQAWTAKSGAQHVSSVEAFGVRCHWKHGLLQGVVSTTWVADRAPSVKEMKCYILTYAEADAKLQQK